MLLADWEVRGHFCTLGEVLFPTRKGSPSFLLPSPHVVGEDKAFVPSCSLCCGWGEMVSPLCSLSTKHCRAFSQPRDGEVKAAVAMEIMHAQRSDVPPVLESSKPSTHFIALKCFIGHIAGTCISKTFP